MPADGQVPVVESLVAVDGDVGEVLGTVAGQRDLDDFLLEAAQSVDGGGTVVRGVALDGQAGGHDVLVEVGPH